MIIGADCLRENLEESREAMRKTLFARWAKPGGGEFRETEKSPRLDDGRQVASIELESLPADECT